MRQIFCLFNFNSDSQWPVNKREFYFPNSLKNVTTISSGSKKSYKTLHFLFYKVRILLISFYEIPPFSKICFLVKISDVLVLNFQ